MIEPRSRPRSAAPDIAACLFLIFCAAFFFALLRSFYETNQARAALAEAAVWGALLALSGVVAWGLFQRLTWALVTGLILCAVTLVAALARFHIPETAELPAGLLSLVSAALLVGGRREFGLPEQKGYTV